MLDIRYLTILRVALPLMGSTFIQSVVLITDSSFLSRYDTVAFDAVGNGGLIYVTLFMAMVGINDGAQILMARRIGQRKEERLARIFGTTLFANTLIASAMFLSFQLFIPSLIESYTHNQAVATGQIDYISIRSYGLFISIVTLAINAYFFALGKTFIVLISSILIALSNIALDYTLIFGHFGFPEMGLEGAALASTMADASGMIFLFIVLYNHKKQKEHRIFSELRFNFNSFIEVLKLGIPIAFQGMIALSTWTIFFAWLEQLGTHELTISQNIRSLYFLAFVPIWGFAATTKTYISQYIGKGDIDSLKIIMRRIQILTIGFLILFFHGALLYPETMISLINPAPQYMEESVEILQFVSGSVLIYGVSSVYFQTINGSGNTRFTFYVELVTACLYILFAYLFIKVFKFDLYWIWSVEYIYFSSVGLFSILYLTLFEWYKKKI